MRRTLSSSTSRSACAALSVILVMLPMGRALAPPPLRFAVYGDTRDDHATHRRIVEDVMANHPAFVLQTGDLVHHPSIEAEWKIFDEITAAMRGSIPYYPAYGNHDVGRTSHFDRYLPPEVVAAGRRYYSFEKGRLHFVCIDTEDSLSEDSPQHFWIERDLKKAKDEKRTLVAFFHKAIFSPGPHVTESNVRPLRPLIHPLLRRYGVVLAFEGHDHLYYRTVRDGIVYVVTGGGGAPLYEPENRDQMIPDDVLEKAHHFCICDVFEDRIEVSAYRVDRSRIDALTIKLPAAN